MYLANTELAIKEEAIVDKFIQIRNDIGNEKSSRERVWKLENT